MYNRHLLEEFSLVFVGHHTSDTNFPVQLKSDWRVSDSPRHSPKKYVVNLLANERSQAEKFAVDPMQDGLETVSFAWIFAVK